MGTMHLAPEGSTLENKMFLDNVEVKRRRFDRLLQIAHVQAEEEWNSNIKWIMREFGKKTNRDSSGVGDVVRKSKQVADGQLSATPTRQNSTGCQYINKARWLVNM